jgi:hypothetical protein
LQLQTDLWIEGAYYVDFDKFGQLRIVGPNNHLHFGSVGIYKNQIAIDSVYSEDQELVIKGRLLASKLFFHDPAIGAIPHVRHFTDRPGHQGMPFDEIIRRDPADLAPNFIESEVERSGYEIIYKRLYQRHWYGVRLELAPGVSIDRHERRRGYMLTTNDADIGFTLTTDTDQRPGRPLERVVRAKPYGTNVFGRLKPQVDRLMDRTAIEITHLVNANKTSGFDYGTVFPRDWMEAADLGQYGLEPEAIRYMYHRAFEFVNPQGVGWHENIVGEFEFEKKQEMTQLSTSLDDLVERSSRIRSALQELIGQVEEMYVIRSMIDIEPRYVLGLGVLSIEDLGGVDIERLRKVARFILLQAEHNELITFKKMPILLRRHKHDEYYLSGNWRDSEAAFKRIHPVVAPYDVNVVFYPRALELIRRHAQMLQVDPERADKLVHKWAQVREWYRFTNPDGLPAYGLALYDIRPGPRGLRHKLMAVNHTDEAYELFYGTPTEAEVASFARRLLSPKYFYTKSGPLVVGVGQGYNTTQYHGEVIWTKQTAYIVAGLSRQLTRGEHEDWKMSTLKLIRRAALKTAIVSIRAFVKLGEIPELHYDRDGQPRPYDDQPNAEGPMNKVQLWSAVGARRIIKEYIRIYQHERLHTR